MVIQSAPRACSQQPVVPKSSTTSLVPTPIAPSFQSMMCLLPECQFKMVCSHLKSSSFSVKSEARRIPDTQATKVNNRVFFVVP